MISTNRKTKKWLILSPLLIIAFIYVIAYISIEWYQNSLYNKLEKTSYNTNYLLMYNQLDRKINNIENDDRIIFEGENPYVNDKRLMNYFNFSLNQPSDYTFILKYEKNTKKLKVLYSSSLNIKAGTYLPKNKYTLMDKYTMDSLLEKNEYYVKNSYDKTNTLFKLFKYYPYSNLIICVGSIREKHSISYAKYIKLVTNDINHIRTMVILLELALSLLGALLISYIIKRSISAFEASQNKLEMSNENLKMSNKALENQLLLDLPTNLPNARSLRVDIDKMRMPKLILIDIDDFRKMNEYYPPKAISRILKHVKDALLNYAEKYHEFNMKLYRTDTNQFALLEDAPLDTEKYESLAINLSNRLKGVRVKSDENGNYAEFNCTIGFSLEEKNVYETAITALRRAREREKDYICYFKNLGEEEEFRKQVKGADFIKKALESDKVVPFFQPIYDKEKNILKHECLMRIIDENGKVVSPYMFLETSKRIKRYTQIEKALIRKSLEAINGTNRVVSINLSSRDMIDSEVKNFVIDEVVKRNLERQIIFEIVEDENIEDIKRVSEFINRVKTMGIRIAIDDFGSGYSNYSYALNLKPDYIKIDGSLIKNLEFDNISHAIVSSIILFTKRLGIKTIAEYVHNEKVFEICKDLGIDEFQGFYLSEPKAHLS